MLHQAWNATANDDTASTMSAVSAASTYASPNMRSAGPASTTTPRTAGTVTAAMIAADRFASARSGSCSCAPSANIDSPTANEIELTTVAIWNAMKYAAATPGP